WGVENRTCALRVIPNGRGTRIENRQTAADINPYTAMATCLASGLWGIERAVTPPPPITGDATAIEGATEIPRTLEQATAALKKSETAREILGEDFVDHYVRTREWEILQARTAVTDWELARYF